MLRVAGEQAEDAGELMRRFFRQRREQLPYVAEHDTSR